MTLKPAHQRHAALIDIRVYHMLKLGVSDNKVIDCIEQNYKKFLSVKTHATVEEFDQLCIRYKGFGYFGQLVESLKKKAGAGTPSLPSGTLSRTLPLKGTTSN